MTLLYSKIENGEYSIGDGTETSGIKEGKSYATELLVIPENNEKKVTEISLRALFGCAKIKNVIIEARIKKLNQWSFAQCQTLNSIVLPSSIEEICHGSFDDCLLLTSVTFKAPYSLKIIGKRSFNTCRKLKEFIIPTTVKTIGEDAFTEIEVSTTFYYCGHKTFLGNIIDNKPENRIIVPYDGPKRFGPLTTTYCESNGAHRDPHKTLHCKCNKQSSFASCIFLVILVS